MEARAKPPPPPPDGGGAAAINALGSPKIFITYVVCSDETVVGLHNPTSYKVRFIRNVFLSS